MVECSGTAKLIEAVKEHPMLYDLCNENYRNKVVTNKKWMEIGDLLDIHGEIAKKKWKGLRDSYTKHLRATRSNGRVSLELSRYKSWPWADRMSFLRPSTLDPAQADSNDVEDTSPTVDIDESVFTPIIETTFSTNKQNTKDKKRKEDLDNFYTQPIRERLPEIDDDIDLMFKSYAKTVKRFSARRKIFFKTKLAKLIAEEELANLNELPAKCSTCSSAVSASDHWTANNPGMDCSENGDTEQAPTNMNSPEAKAVHFLCNDWK
ncbi:uncharacterized protein LOC111050410 isoform X1 [Nilaparvata lugens]|uniref:uncharacterized protein LOC111050410 isoform X1 n=1 Tax=Nilaparvata lugens TaxID=108931 RepID=UPI000B996564|nr:uncharacterized protein LOC111050410 isoform X1 [Nilaparvata lugens]